MSPSVGDLVAWWDSAGMSSGVGVNRLVNVGARQPVYSGCVPRLLETLSRTDSGGLRRLRLARLVP